MIVTLSSLTQPNRLHADHDGLMTAAKLGPVTGSLLLAEVARCFQKHLAGNTVQLHAHITVQVSSIRHQAKGALNRPRANCTLTHVTAVVGTS